jgi:hypothetical protein
MDIETWELPQARRESSGQLFFILHEYPSGDVILAETYLVHKAAFARLYVRIGSVESREAEKS